MEDIIIKDSRPRQRRDLKIECAQYIGYSVTSPTDRFIEVIKEMVCVQK